MIKFIKGPTTKYGSTINIGAGISLLEDSAGLVQLTTSGTGTAVSTVAGTTNRITASPATGDVIIDISSNYAGQTSITTLGTIVTGTWDANAILVGKGGTGSTSYSSNKFLVYSGTAIVSSAWGGPDFAPIVHASRHYTGGADVLALGSIGGTLVNTQLSTIVPYTNIRAVGTLVSGTWNASVVGINYGGTGLSTLVDAGRLLYSTGASGLTTLAHPGAMRYLMASGTSSFVWVTSTGSGGSINESDIIDGSILARVAANEVIEGTWTFNNQIKLNAGIGFYSSSILRHSIQISGTGGLQVAPTSSASNTNFYWLDSGSAVRASLDMATGNFTATGSVEMRGVSYVKGDTGVAWNYATLYLWDTAAGTGKTFAIGSLGSEFFISDESASVRRVTMTTYGDFRLLTGYLSVPSGKGIYFDGGSDTYLYESSSNVMDFYVGGTRAFALATAGAYFPGNDRPIYMQDTASAFVRVMQLGSDNNLYFGLVDAPASNGNIIFRAASADRMVLSPTSLELVDIPLVIRATQKLYLDGGVNTYIAETAGDVISFVAGGVGTVDVTNTALISAVDVKISATKKLYLDGGGNTYIIESAADTIRLYTGGSSALTVTSSALTPLADVKIATTKRLYFDGGDDTYFSELTANTLYLVVGGVAVLVGTTAGVSFPDGLAVSTGKKLFLDGGGSGNTYIIEYSADVVRHYAGNVAILELNTTGAVLIGDLTLQATKQLYFDGGGDTYIYESGANILDLVVGGVDRLYFNGAGATLFTAGASANYVRFRNNVTRYRSDYSIASTGLSINVFDDTGGVFLPIVLDGTTLTVQSSSNTRFSVSNTQVKFWAADVLIDTAKKLYLDGGTGDYITADSDHHIYIYQNGIEKIRFATNLWVNWTGFEYLRRYADAPIFLFSRADGALGSEAALAEGAVIGYTNWEGYDGNTWFTGATIYGRVNNAGAWTSTTHGTDLTFATTTGNSGGATLTNRWQIKHSGGFWPYADAQYNIGDSIARINSLYLGGQIISTLASGTAPFTLLSSTKVVNLNANYLEGHLANYFSAAGHTHIGTFVLTNPDTDQTIQRTIESTPASYYTHKFYSGEVVDTPYRSALATAWMVDYGTGGSLAHHGWRFYVLGWSGTETSFTLQNSVNGGSWTDVFKANQSTCAFYTNLSVPAGSLLQIDGGGDTYLYENGANVIALRAGGTDILQLSTSYATFAKTPVLNISAADSEIQFQISSTTRGRLGVPNAAGSIMTNSTQYAMGIGAQGAYNVEFGYSDDVKMLLDASEAVLRPRTSSQLGLGTSVYPWDKSYIKHLILGSGAAMAGTITHYAEHDIGVGTAYNFQISGVFKRTVTAAHAFTFTAPYGPTTLVIRLISNGTSYTPTWPAAVKWAGGIAPATPTTNGYWVVVTLYFDGTNYTGSFSAAAG